MTDSEMDLQRVTVAIGMYNALDYFMWAFGLASEEVLIDAYNRFSAQDFKFRSSREGS